MTKSIQISGASSGIGTAAAIRLANDGFAVYAGVRNDVDARAVAALHRNIRSVTLDVTDDVSIRDATERAASEDTLVGVICNAGIALGGPLERVAMERLRRQFEVNVFGALALAQAALRYVPERQGRIVFVGSIAGRLAIPYSAPYSASKFALRAIADAMRIELSPAGIFVSLIEPGSVDTPIWRKGRAARDEMERELGDSHRPHYREAVERTLEQTVTEERTGMPVERVADAIAHAVESSKPRPSYLLGAPARAGSILALLPPRLRDHAMRAAMRFP